MSRLNLLPLLLVAACGAQPQRPVAVAAVAAAAPAPALEPRPQYWPPAPRALAGLPVNELRQPASGPQLVNGIIADVKDWPATFYATLDNRWNCTTTLIGPRVLLAAAHCVEDGGSVTVTRNNIAYSGVCTRPDPGYPNPVSNDWMLCAMDERVPASKYERISRDPKLLQRGRKLTLGGGGCTTVGGGRDGTFRIGSATVDRLPGEYGGEAERNWIVTRRASAGESSICEGDSGGAVYFAPPGGGAARFVVGVNSHRDDAGQGVSFLSATSTSDAAQYFADWHDRQVAATKDPAGFAICGLQTDDPHNCR